MLTYADVCCTHCAHHIFAQQTTSPAVPSGRPPLSTACSSYTTACSSYAGTDSTYGGMHASPAVQARMPPLRTAGHKRKGHVSVDEQRQAHPAAPPHTLPPPSGQGVSHTFTELSQSILSAYAGGGGGGGGGNDTESDSDDDQLHRGQGGGGGGQGGGAAGGAAGAQEDVPSRARHPLPLSAAAPSEIAKGLFNTWTCSKGNKRLLAGQREAKNRESKEGGWGGGGGLSSWGGGV
jgi:hypothetical protein